jgi:Dickkopf N-terminal cysteine-rich region
VGECKDPTFECVMSNTVCGAACKARIPVGKSCDPADGSPCVLGASCRKGQCATLPGLGDACSDVCAEGLWCATAPGASSLACRHTALGNPCEMTKDCPYVLGCVGVAHDNAGQATLGQCQPGFPWGTPCSEPVPCAIGLVCGMIDATSRRMECRSEDQYCRSVFCGSGMSCIDPEWTCLPSLPHNAPCSDTDHQHPCPVGESCSRVGNGSTQQMACQTNQRREGDACEPGSSCEAGTFCPEGPNATCTKYRKPGETCQTDADCGPYDAECTNGKCIPCQ